MNAEIFGLLLQDGIATGAVYVLLALALVMVFAVTRIVFVPQGEFVACTVLTVAGWQQGRAASFGWLVLAAACAAGTMEALERRRGHDLAALPRRLVVLLVLPA